jgi:alanyl-tRNA synthetase
VDDLDHVPVANEPDLVLGTRDDLAVLLDGDGTAAEPEVKDERAHRKAVRHVLRGPVDHDLQDDTFTTRRPHLLPGVNEEARPSVTCGKSHDVMTEKLYWSDPHLTSFEASTLTLGEHTGKPSVVLERSLFYPEGGGQLGDTGSLDVTTATGRRTLHVVDTQVDDDGTIHHVLDGSPADAAELCRAEGVTVRGRIDASRRRDHMAQHTAQHALSRALADVARADTVSARLGVTTCTIDVSRPGIPDADLHRAEDLVNALVASDVPVVSLFPDREELARLPLRKQPKVTEGVIRVIDIDGFDMTPCGGTHCTRTGQIGQARIVGLEKHKGMLRLTFHAGLRALTDARAKHDALTLLAADLTCGIPDVAGAVTKLRTELKASRTQLEAVRTELAELVARAALDALPPADTTPGPIVVPILRGNDDVGPLRVLAGKLAVDPRVVAVAAGTDGTTEELVVVVQRGSAGRLDCGAFIKAQGTAHGGRGGGRPERAEGRFPRGTSLDVIASAARAALS